MNRKKLLITGLSLLLVAAVSVGATLAYFTDTSEAASNVFTLGHVSAELIDRLPEDYEDTQDDHTWKGDETDDGIVYEEVLPGDFVEKEVGFSIAADSMNARVAIRVETEVTSLPGATTTITQATVAEELSDQIKNYVAMTKGELWEAVQDPNSNNVVIYYFRTVAPAGTDNVLLFDGVPIPGAEWGNEYAGMSFTVKVQMAAVQADNVSYDDFKGMSWDQFQAYPLPTPTAGTGTETPDEGAETPVEP